MNSIIFSGLIFTRSVFTISGRTDLANVRLGGPLGGEVVTGPNVMLKGKDTEEGCAPSHLELIKLYKQEVIKYHQKHKIYIATI